MICSWTSNSPWSDCLRCIELPESQRNLAEMEWLLLFKGDPWTGAPPNGPQWGPNGPRCAQIGLNGPKLVSMGPNVPQWALMGLNGPKWASMGPTGPQWAQIKLNGPKLAQWGRFTGGCSPFVLATLRNSHPFVMATHS